MKSLNQYLYTDLPIDELDERVSVDELEERLELGCWLDGGGGGGGVEPPPYCEIDC